MLFRSEFTGTVVFVSHDRYFIDKLATRVFEVEDGRVHVFPGNYEDYWWRKSGGAAPAVEARQAAHAIAEPGQPAAPLDAGPGTRPARLNPIKLRRMRERREEIEVEVSKLEVEIADYESALGHFVSVEETVRLSDLVTVRRSDLAGLLKEWETVAQSIEANG